MANMVFLMNKYLLLFLVVIGSSHSEEDSDSKTNCASGQCRHSNEMEHEKMKYTKEQNEGFKVFVVCLLFNFY